MKVYLSIDMEGLAGINHPHPTGRADSGYPAAYSARDIERAMDAVIDSFMALPPAPGG